jgi:Autotransporter beta-domain
MLEETQGSFAATAGLPKKGNGLAVARALDSAAGDPRAAALIGFLDQWWRLEFQRRFCGGKRSGGQKWRIGLRPSPDNRWGVFVTGLGEFTNVDTTPNAAGYDIDTGGFTLGIDYRVTPNFAVGLTGGYAHTTVNLDGGGNIDVDGGKISLYGTYFGNGFYLESALSVGPSGYDTRRTALLGSASGSTDGTDLNVLFAAGYDWRTGNLTVGPTACFQYNYVELNGFTESGSIAPLKFPTPENRGSRMAVTSSTFQD